MSASQTLNRVTDPAGSDRFELFEPSMRVRFEVFRAYSVYCMKK
jgi:hypothetical protein